ncbi:S8 family serine peptidase [Pseudoxanthomonas wuyuanensis]|uniref:Subtilase family protein n=1 Tax=Pseudoxanthomonas wuyuanensis TaxID=1073196 RepID=A0A286D9J6_9GAMM|nr:S8 family serine peptidase [Pseudoxanthomonas wuyuanensis]SOD55303.1 Subtilase family protein [Pseudoxanthomonas wuyuanensis]
MFPVLKPSMPLFALAIACAATPAHAQNAARLPAAMPALPALQTPAGQALPQAVQRAQGILQDTASSGLTQLRRLEIEKRLRLHRDVLDTDNKGAPVLRSQVIAIDPAPEALQRARSAGFAVIDERSLDGLDLRIVVLRSPDGTGTRAALRKLRRLDPAGSYDFNHVYSGSAAVNAQVSTAASATAPPSKAVRIGLIDSGVSGQHPALAGVDMKVWGCEGEAHPDAHGTAVASLLVGGAAAGSTLYSADIYCGRPTGGAVSGFAQAMAWMARERVGVINLSLVGPDNHLLQRAIQALAARGHVLVAAVGNDGPAAPPLFPAAYPEVIGVTAVDQRQRALPEAGRGRQVDFAARGSQLRVARPDGDWDTVRGTSFAAPLVARAAAQLIGAPGEAEAIRVRAQLIAQAVDLGSKGRDNTYGHGLLDALPTAAVAETR